MGVRTLSADMFSFVYIVGSMGVSIDFVGGYIRVYRHYRRV